MTPQNSSTYFWAVYGPASLDYPVGDKLPPSRFDRTDPLHAPAMMVIHPDATTPAMAIMHPDATGPLRITVGHVLDAPPPATPGPSLQKGAAGMRIRFGAFHATVETAVAAMEGEWPQLATQGALYAELCRLDSEFAQ